MRKLLRRYKEIKKMRLSSPWRLAYNNFEPSEEGLREALCTLGNGYFATRGTFPEALASRIHYPGTYIAGVYNRLTTHISGKSVFNEEIVNSPNWTFLTFKIGDGEWFYPSTGGIIFFHQVLDMRQGILTRRIRFKDDKGRKTLIETERIVDMSNPHLGAMRYIITPENYSEWVTVRTMLDGTVLNTGVERYRQLNSKHWDAYSLGGFGKNGIYLSMKTNQSKIEVVQASKIRMFTGQQELKPSIKCLAKGKERIGQEFRFFLNKGHSYKIEKTVSIYTSQDKDIHSPKHSAIEAAQSSLRFKAMLRTHKQVWDKLWRRFDVQIKGDDFSQKVLRLHIFHLLQTASIHNINIDAGFPARGLHGEAYRGHIFWDEIFALPFFDFHIPEISKALLLYRCRRLAKAREAAKQAGYSGAMFPWQSGSSGKEETQVIHLNPMSGTWGPDHSHLQRHVSFAIVYNVWQHYKRLNDIDFLISYGAELILSVAQFGASLAKYDSRDGKYHTEGLVGPDEFHEALPGSDKPGLRDNAYTNLMIVWTLLKAQEVISVLPEAYKSRMFIKLKLNDEQFARWDEITRKMNIIVNQEGIISQFEGYFDLKELDWDGYRRRYEKIERMDRILKAEGESPDNYKVTKQADTLMFFYLFPFPEIEKIFRRLGKHFDKNTLRKNFDYYLKRTSHGSTLSKVVFCFLGHSLGKTKETWRLFQQVLESDINDTQGDTTPEGIHAGVMAASIDIVIRGFAGISTYDGVIRINPNLPKDWQKIKLRFFYKQRWISLMIAKDQVIIRIQGPIVKSAIIPIEINGKLHQLPLGRTSTVNLRKK
ncbi:glycoside hydrolase family 65 protein [Candidatus Omnitrophota bacterium]